MKKLLIILIMASALQVTHAQAEPSASAYSSIETLLRKNYIGGSSRNQTEVMQSAFADNATFYLTIKDEYQKLSLNGYLSYFKNEPGKFNGRYGKVLSIEVVQDIANAKVEISIPDRKIAYIDMFLLKKTSEGWKVISKTATKIDRELK
ncbi:MAG: nuclear transport factor 2 family protein [Rubripirellula sp.]